ncbi:C40 family peptidase [Planctomonas psychrotolerans]|uniref:C40 family peptidase n=1 Tax=Planctomonas psychrotolerans TaxID=2528712 RepID=UPI00123B7DAD|nr:C40 family peptidase [Planctomonas psychrotolerans]
MILGDTIGSSQNHANPNLTSDVPPLPHLASRRELHSVARPAFVPTVELTPSVEVLRAQQALTGSLAVTPHAIAAAKKRKLKRTAANAVVMTFVSGLIGVLALPAYAAGPAETIAQAPASLSTITASNAQTLAVTNAVAPSVTRDTFSATSLAEIQAREAEEARIAAEAAAQAAAQAAAAQAAAAAAASAASTQSATATSRRAEIATTDSTYSGPTADALVAAAPYASSSPSQVAAVAMQYQGVPYRLGGATPAGFDCSGLVMYVYAQFGVSLPHGVRGQAASGTRISRAEAQPGDLVIWNNHSHNGIYLGNGNFIDAPRPGKSVIARPIWSQDVYFVRIAM